MAEIASEVSLVICTKDRLEDLSQLLASVLQQDPLPAEIIVVDDGHLAAIPHADSIRKAGIALVHHAKSTPGICCSRNVGARLAGHELVMYLDDDTILQRGYVGEMARLFREHPDVMGARGHSDTTDGPDQRRGQGAWQALERFFLLRGTGHRILPSGFGNADWDSFPSASPVQFLTGCTTYRKSVFNSIQYDEALEELGPYAFGEDLAFSYRVGRDLGPFDYLPGARLAHVRNTHPRLAPAHLSRLRLHNQYYIYRTCFRPHPANPPAFAWAIIGKCTLALLGVLLRPSRSSWDGFVGTLEGAVLVGRMALGLSAIPKSAYLTIKEPVPGK